MLSLAQQTSLALIPKVTGFISVICCSLILYDVVRDRKKWSSTYYRLLGFISCVDILVSFCIALSTWPIPRESGMLWAVGTTATCSLQGFFAQFGTTSILYHGSLSFYYLFVIRYGWKDDRIRKAERFMHVIPLVWGLGTSIAGLCLKLFNNALLWCWIAPDPRPDRGQHADIYRWAFFYGPLWLTLIVTTVNLILVFCHVRKTELSSNRFRFESSLVNRTSAFGNDISPQTGAEEVTSGAFSRKNRRRSSVQARKNLHRTREVSRQFLGYCIAAYLVWTPLTLLRLTQTISGKTYYPLLLLAVIMTPFHGLPRIIVYLAPRFAQAKREHPNAGAWYWFKSSLGPKDEDESSTEHT